MPVLVQLASASPATTAELAPRAAPLVSASENGLRARMASETLDIGERSDQGLQGPPEPFGRKDKHSGYRIKRTDSGLGAALC